MIVVYFHWAYREYFINANRYLPFKSPYLLALLVRLKVNEKAVLLFTFNLKFKVCSNSHIKQSQNSRRSLCLF